MLPPAPSPASNGDAADAAAAPEPEIDLLRQAWAAREEALRQPAAHELSRVQREQAEVGAHTTATRRCHKTRPAGCVGGTDRVVRDVWRVRLLARAKSKPMERRRDLSMTHRRLESATSTSYPPPLPPPGPDEQIVKATAAVRRRRVGIPQLRDEES